MLKKIERFLNIIKSAASGIAGILFGYLLKKYINKNPDDSILLTIVMAIALFIVLALINYLTTLLVEKSKWLRKLLLGKHFIEGVWVQGIDIKSVSIKQPIYSIVYITFDKDHLNITGESFNKKGEFLANFHSVSSEYNNHILRYPFTVKTLENGEMKIFGTSKLTFSLTDELPNRFLGIVYSNLREKPINVIGRRINEKIDMKSKDGINKIKSILK
jgi:hypothetical protein